MDSHYKAYYSGHASRFDSLRLDTSEEIARFVHEASRALPHPVPGVGLEVGCGTGRYATAIQGHLLPCIGLDLSYSQLKHAACELRLVQGDARTLPFRNATFAFCFAVLMLHQNDPTNQSQILAEMVRVLEPGGCVMIKTCSHFDLERRPFNDLFPSSLGLNKKRYLPIEEICDRLTELSACQIKVIPTHTQTIFDKESLIRSYEGRHNTTLTLIPEEEVASGLAGMRRRLEGLNDVVFDNWHTIIVGTK